MVISSSKIVTEDEKKYIIQNYSCRNRNCQNYNKVVKTVKTELTKDS